MPDNGSRAGSEHSRCCGFCSCSSVNQHPAQEPSAALAPAGASCGSILRQHHAGLRHSRLRLRGPAEQGPPSLFPTPQGAPQAAPGQGCAEICGPFLQRGKEKRSKLNNHLPEHAASLQTRKQQSQGPGNTGE